MQVDALISNATAPPQAQEQVSAPSTSSKASGFGVCMVWPDVIIEPQKLGPDLRISKLLRLRGDNPRNVFCVKAPDDSVVYRFMHLEQRPDGTYDATIEINAHRENLVKQSKTNSSTEKLLSKMWKEDAYTNKLNRMEFVKRFAYFMSMESMEHFMENLTFAITNLGEDFASRVINRLEQSVDEETLEYDLSKPLAVCSQCNLHTVRKLKQCPCKRGIYFCSKECQKLHWKAGHKLEHACDASDMLE